MLFSPEEAQMAEYQVTVSGEALQGLFQGGAGLAKLLEQVLNQVLEAQVSEQLRAGRLPSRARSRWGTSREGGVRGMNVQPSWSTSGSNGSWPRQRLRFL